MIYVRFQALTTPRKIRLPIGQAAGKNHVAPLKIKVAPLSRELLYAISYKIFWPIAIYP